MLLRDIVLLLLLFLPLLFVRGLHQSALLFVKGWLFALDWLFVKGWRFAWGCTWHHSIV